MSSVNENEGKFNYSNNEDVSSLCEMRKYTLFNILKTFNENTKISLKERGLVLLSGFNKAVRKLKLLKKFLKMCTDNYLLIITE